MDEDHYGLSKVKERITSSWLFMALNKKTVRFRPALCGSAGYG